MQKTLKKYFAFFALPTLLAFLIAFVIPFIVGLYLSFTEFTTVTNSKWVGFSNYANAFASNFKGNCEFMDALWFTVKFTLVSVVTINVLAFALAYALTRGIKGTNLFRTVFFMPNLIGGIVLGWIWQLLINAVLEPLGLTITSSANHGFWGLVILMNWQLIGYMMIIYIAGIQNIPTELIDAAWVDGASGLQTLKNVIIPMVMPAITICLFLTITNSFKLFDQNLVLTGGAPGKQTTMMALDIYNSFYGSGAAQGTAQAKAVVFFVLVALISGVQLVLTRKKEVES